MKTLVVYESAYGHTKQYAQWIAQALQADLWTVDAASDVNLAGYDTILFGGPVYVGKIKGIKWLAGQAEALAGKRVFLFTTGMTPPGNTQVYADLMQQQPLGAVKLAGVFHLPGAVDAGKLKLVHRMIFSMVQKMASSGKGPEGMELQVDQSAIGPIVKAARQ